MKKKLTIVLSAILIILLGVCAALWMWNPVQKGLMPDEALRAYYKALEAKKYEEMYRYLTKDAKQSINRETFVKRNQNIYEGIEASGIQITFTDQDIHYADDEKSASVSFQTSMNTVAGEIHFGTDVTFVKDEEGNYKIAWTPEMIYPELRDGSKLRVQTTAARRGEIFDRNGVVLARNGIVTSVGIVPGKMGSDRAGTLTQLSELLGISIERIEKKLGAGWVTEESFVPIKEIAKNQPELESALIAIPGVMLTDAEERVYPLGAAAGHLTGYVAAATAEDLEKLAGEGYHSGSIIGKSGLEAAYEKELRPRDGASILIVNENGDQTGIMAQTNPQDGQNVTVTIDSAVQTNLYEQFAEDEGAAVAMNPKTGEVLALVSTPGIDPNEFVLGMSDARWEELNNDPMQPLANRYNASWVSGSTLKPVIGAIGIESGKLDPNKDMGHSGRSWQKDAGWGNYFVTTLTEYDAPASLENALVYSDNIYFAKAALQIGEKALIEGFQKMGFTEEMQMPFDLKIHASTFSTDGRIEKEIQLADTGYGQGQMMVNPVHLASVYSAFVNDGNMMLPVLKLGTEPSFFREHVCSPETAQIIRDGMRQVIERSDGTGHAMKMDGIDLCGKTGTAETKKSQDETDATEFGWFACETVSSEQPLEVIAMVKDIQSKGVHGYVTLKVRNVFSAYYNH